MGTEFQSGKVIVVMVYNDMNVLNATEMYT